jgi:steroid delta-isomerase-like uncharacterized protein
LARDAYDVIFVFQFQEGESSMPATPDSIVRAWFEEVWNQGNEESIDRLYAPDGLAHGLSSDGSPIVGPDAYKPFYRTFRGAFPDMRVEVLRTITEGDLVTAHCHVTGTHTGDHLGLLPTDRPVDFSGICIVRVRDGQILEAWNNFDFLRLYQQVGLLPAI